ncbi:MAG: hypothetical protein PUG15_07260 [Bacteroidales bacterium]|nr:hypothetical protein [Bacteroidales bacterium]
MKRFLKYLLLVVFVFSVMLNVFLIFRLEKELNRTSTTAALRNELYERETSPFQYLSIENGAVLKASNVKVRNGNLFHEAEYETVYDVKFKIASTATVTTFKDVEVSFMFYRGNTLLKTENETLQGDFHPYSERNFSIRVNPPSGYDSWNMMVKDAGSRSKVDFK